MGAFWKRATVTVLGLFIAWATLLADDGSLPSNNNKSGDLRLSTVPTSSEEVLVAKGDTLREIADKNRVRELTTQQMMLALLAANPQAFINDNINFIQAGAILRVPDKSEIILVNQSQAVAEIARQEQLWRKYSDGADTVIGAQTTSSDILVSEQPDAPKFDAMNRKLEIAREELASTNLRFIELSSANEKLLLQVRNMELLLASLQNKADILERQLIDSHRSSSAIPDALAITNANGSTLNQNDLSGEQKTNVLKKMGWINVLSFAVVAALLVISPGPNGVLIAKTVPSSGKAAGFANVAGFVAAFNFHGTLSILGISAILLASPKAFFIVKMLGATYLCWIGFKALREAYRDDNVARVVEPTNQRHTLRSAFFEGLLTNALNPKTSMFYLAAFPQFISTGEGAVASGYALVFLHTIINVAWFGAMVVLFARLTKIAKNGSFQRWLNGVTGVVFVGFGLKLATYRT